MMGLCAGLSGKKWGLGFIEETEKQVEAHLEDQLKTLPEQDTLSRAIVQQMCEDEKTHAQWAHDEGAARLPSWLKTTMSLTAQCMKKMAYWI